MGDLRNAGTVTGIGVGAGFLRVNPASLTTAAGHASDIAEAIDAASRSVCSATAGVADGCRGFALAGAVTGHAARWQDWGRARAEVFVATADRLRGAAIAHRDTEQATARLFAGPAVAAPSGSTASTLTPEVNAAGAIP